MRDARQRVVPTWLPLLAGVLILLLGSGVVEAQERPGTLSLGVQGQYGLIAGPSDFAELYNHGAGFAFRIRYALGGPQAFGISFESQTFGADASSVSTDEIAQPDKLKFSNATVEYLRYFNRGEGQSQYMVLGLGLYHPSDERTTGLEVSSDGLILAFGGGSEFFSLRTTSIDLSVRANALFGGDAVSATLELGIGIHHYMIR